MTRQLIDAARPALWSRTNLRWLIGGSGSGKSTIAQALGARTGITVYDMDVAVFGRFRFDPVRHPATTAWFTAGNPLQWMLSRPWEAFDALYRANNAEVLDLLADDLVGQPDEPLLLDGGITHPSVLTQVIPAARIICLERDEAQRATEWDTSPTRTPMRDEIVALPDGETLWQRFQEYDRRMTATLSHESRECGIPIVRWGKGDTVEQVDEQVLRLLY
jgi:hypothetical protein